MLFIVRCLLADSEGARSPGPTGADWWVGGSETCVRLR